MGADIMRKILVLNLIVLAFLLTANTNPIVEASTQGSPLLISPQDTYQQSITVEREADYAIHFWVQGDEPNAVLSLTVRLVNSRGSQVGLTQVYRGIGSVEDWYPLGVEFATPKDVKEAQFIIGTDRVGAYRWDGLTVVKLDKSPDGVREFWERKFEQYGQVYTGLVVDARGLGLKRGMSPRILSETGQLIYGGVTASLDYVQNVGLVGYGRELTPQLLTRIQVDESYPLAIPLIIEGVEVRDPAQTNVAISSESAQRVLAALAAYDFLARFAVIILVD